MIALFMSIHVLTLYIKLEEKRIIETPTNPDPAILLQKNNTRFASLEYVDVLIPVSLCTFTPLT